MERLWLLTIPHIEDFDAAQSAQQHWQDFCESFLSHSISIVRHFDEVYRIVVVCRLTFDPSEPLDLESWSFLDQARDKGFDPVVLETSIVRACTIPGSKSEVKKGRRPKNKKNVR